MAEKRNRTIQLRGQHLMKYFPQSHIPRTILTLMESAGVCRCRDRRTTGVRMPTVAGLQKFEIGFEVTEAGWPESVLPADEE
jgi:hypothetical protein